MCRHLKSCPACDAFIPPDPGPLDASLEAMCQGDFRDPEFMEASGLRRKQ
jgi:hypothetical protein